MASSSPSARPAAALTLSGVSLSRGGRTLVSGLDLAVEPGEFVAVLGANGAGKSSLLAALLGDIPASGGIVLAGHGPGGGGVGYLSQRPDLQVPVQARELIALGLDGARWGLPLPSRARRARVDALLRRVDAEDFADATIDQLSGGQVQRLRLALALANEPSVLLADEPLVSLDPGSQQRVVQLIDDYRRDTGASVVFVTHEINPILGLVDKVLYLAGPGKHRYGTVDEVLTTESLTELYGMPVHVHHFGHRLVILGGDDAVPFHVEPPFAGPGAP